MAGPKQGDAIDSAMTGFPPVKGMASAPGKYNTNPALGPAGVDGGLPLKFMDDAVKTPGVQATDSPGLVATPMQTTSK